MGSIKICLTSFKTNTLYLGIIIVCVIASIGSLVAIYPSMNSNNSYAELLSAMPQDMLSAIGMNGDVSNLNDYLNMNFYNSIYLYILIALVIGMASKLVAKPLGDTSLVYFLNSSVSRKKFLGSQIIVFNGALLIVGIFSVVSGLLSKILFVNDIAIDMNNFIKTNIELIVIFVFIGSVCFCISTFVNNGTEAITYATSLIVVEYILDMFRKISSKLNALKNFTIFTVYDTDKICGDSHYFVISCMVLLGISIVFYMLALWHFDKRDLYL